MHGFRPGREGRYRRATKEETEKVFADLKPRKHFDEKYVRMVARFGKVAQAWRVKNPLKIPLIQVNIPPEIAKDIPEEIPHERVGLVGSMDELVENRVVELNEYGHELLRLLEEEGKKKAPYEGPTVFMFKAIIEMLWSVPPAQFWVLQAVCEDDRTRNIGFCFQVPPGLERNEMQQKLIDSVTKTLAKEAPGSKALECRVCHKALGWESLPTPFHYIDDAAPFLEAIDKTDKPALMILREMGF